MTRAAGVVLAAGSSRRLGRPKQLLPYRGEELLRVVVREVCRSRCEWVGVVVSGVDPRVDRCLEGLAAARIVNPASEDGVATSIRRGVSWADALACDAVVILACDQPALSFEHVNLLIEGLSTGARVVASRYEDALGVPAVFLRSLFPSLLDLRGDEGARKIVRAETNARHVDWPAGARDVDTTEDAQRYLCE